VRFIFGSPNVSEILSEFLRRRFPVRIGPVLAEQSPNEPAGKYFSTIFLFLQLRVRAREF